MMHKIVGVMEPCPAVASALFKVFDYLCSVDWLEVGEQRDIPSFDPSHFLNRLAQVIAHTPNPEGILDVLVRFAESGGALNWPPLQLTYVAEYNPDKLAELDLHEEGVADVEPRVNTFHISITDTTKGTELFVPYPAYNMPHHADDFDPCARALRCIVTTIRRDVALYRFPQPRAY